MNFLYQKIFNKILYRPYIKRKLHKVGVNFRLGFFSEINKPQYFSFGKHFYSGPFCLFSTNKNNEVEIGDYVMFGPRCMIQGGNHDISFLGYMRLNNQIERSKEKITIENGVWLGANVTVVSGSQIGEGSLIGAMSLVNKTIPPFVVAGGVPVKVLKSRFVTLDELSRTINNTGSNYSVDDIVEIHKKFNIIYA